MNDDEDLPIPDEEVHESSTWWCAGFGNTLIWARLDLLASGVAEVFGATGEILRYDDDSAARMALLDADFREFDGLDEDDAAVMGFDLDMMEPPRANSDEELVRLMVQKIARGLN
ncbi:MAG: hypothetical protein ABI411_12070 [Tahibacter sp.]